MVNLKKMILKKNLSLTFYITSSCFSSIRFVIIPSTNKLLNCFPSALFTICFAAYQADEIFPVTVKIMIDFIRIFSDKATIIFIIF